MMPAESTGACAQRSDQALSRRPRARLWMLAALAAAVVLVAALGPALCAYDPYAQDLSAALLPPSAAHPAGTDRYGRDLLSRIVAGAQPSVLCTLLLVALVAVAGTCVGVTCGWRSGWADVVLMRLADLFLAFPGLVFALAIAGVLGGGMMGAVLALAAIGWPKYARMARGLTLAQLSEPYVAAARLSGSSELALMVRHILPNIAGPLLVTAVLDIGTMMMELAGLSFLGLGAQPPSAEWGAMISDGRSMLQTAPWTVVAPGIAVFACVMVFNLLGDAVRDALDPALRRRAGRRMGT